MTNPGVASAADSIESRFRARTKKSRELAQRASSVFPDGVGRAGMPNELYPVFVDRASGQYLYDVDGNRLLDMSNGHSALPLGHSPAPVVDAIAKQLARGIGFFLMEEGEIRLAEMLRERVPSMEKIRFTASGTEATMFAVRAARAFTGRKLFARAEGSYHGMHDMMCSGMGMNVGTPWMDSGDNPVSNGVLPSVREGVVFLPFNDIEGSRKVIAAHAADLAAVIIEPMLGGGGGIPAEREYLLALRELCDRHKIVLILDEMVTIGLARGGAQEHFGVRADLTTSGKLVGGGMPMGVFGGRADIMSLMTRDASGVLRMFHTGTWNGHPLAMAAGIAQLEMLTPEKFAYLGELGETMRKKVRALAREMRVAVQVTGVQHFSAFHYTSQPVRNRRDAVRADPKLSSRVSFSLLSQGFYMLGQRTNLSTAITHQDIDEFISALAVAFEEAGAVGTAA
jgi:glutamate-1-semialdehyde 2,1-aminomutase